MSRRAALFGVVALALPATAHAHLNSTGMGPVYDGSLHFLTSPDDVIAPLALALFAGARGLEHARRALFALPGAWFAGGLAGLPAPAMAGGGVASALWLLALGGLLALDAKLSPRALTALALVVGAAHGFSNGGGLGVSLGSLAALLGLAATVFALVALAAALASRVRDDWTRIALRVAGSWIAATGLLWLGWAVRGTAR